MFLLRDLTLVVYDSKRLGICWEESTFPIDDFLNIILSSQRAQMIVALNLGSKDS